MTIANMRRLLLAGVAFALIHALAPAPALAQRALPPILQNDAINDAFRPATIAGHALGEAFRKTCLTADEKAQLTKLAGAAVASLTKYRKEIGDIAADTIEGDAVVKRDALLKSIEARLEGLDRDQVVLQFARVCDARPRAAAKEQAPPVAVPAGEQQKVCWTAKREAELTEQVALKETMRAQQAAKRADVNERFEMLRWQRSPTYDFDVDKPKQILSQNDIEQAGKIEKATREEIKALEGEIELKVAELEQIDADIESLEDGVKQLKLQIENLRKTKCEEPKKTSRLEKQPVPKPKAPEPRIAKREQPRPEVDQKVAKPQQPQNDPGRDALLTGIGIGIGVGLSSMHRSEHRHDDRGGAMELRR